MGRQLLTKKMGVTEDSGFVEADKEDITMEYKPLEGTRAERVTLYTAARRSVSASHLSIIFFSLFNIWQSLLLPIFFA